jgi:hypothetical protein
MGNLLLLTFLLVFTVINTAIIVFFLLNVRKTYREVMKFVSPGPENAPSQLAVLIDTIAHSSGQAIAMEVKTTLMGKASGLARSENAAVGEIVEDQLAAHVPLASLLLNALPGKLKKTIMRNPDLIQSILSKIGTPGPGSNGSKEVSVPDNQVRFNL